MTDSKIQLICVVCKREARSYNYGVITCESCKMFYYRANKLGNCYKCHMDNRCHNYTKEMKIKKCRGCRWKKCLSVGMEIVTPNKVKTEITVNDEFVKLIEELTRQNDDRGYLIENYTSDSNPSLESVVSRRNFNLRKRLPNHNSTSEEINYLGILATVRFFLGIPFMQELGETDKMALLKNFTGKAALFSYSWRIAKNGEDKLVKIDSTGFFSNWRESIQNLAMIRDFMVVKLNEMGMTNEEFVLTTAVLFCDSTLFYLSSYARCLVGTHQKLYSSALFQYCLKNYKTSGPARFSELLSVSHSLKKHIDALQALRILFNINNNGTQSKQLVVDILDDVN